MPRSSHEEFYAQSFIRLLCFLQNPPGGAASPLPDSSPHGQRGSCPSHVAKSCAKLSKQISGNHRPTRRTRLTRPTSPSAKREALLPMPEASPEKNAATVSISRPFSSSGSWLRVHSSWFRVLQLETKNQKLGTFTSYNHIFQNRHLLAEDFHCSKQGPHRVPQHQIYSINQTF